MALRIVYWLRHPAADGDVGAASPMSQVRSALTQLDELGLDIWTSDEGGRSPIRVDRSGRVFLALDETVSDAMGGLVIRDALDLLGPFESVGGRKAPDLIRPRPSLRIVPGKLSGEPHIGGSRVMTRSLDALARRGFTVERIAALYPGIGDESIAQALDLERQLG
jgi:uncharacterized protein (DUF433 family)